MEDDESFAAFLDPNYSSETFANAVIAGAAVGQTLEKLKVSLCFSMPHISAHDFCTVVFLSISRPDLDLPTRYTRIQKMLNQRASPNVVHCTMSCFAVRLHSTFNNSHSMNFVTCSVLMSYISEWCAPVRQRATESSM